MNNEHKYEAYFNWPAKKLVVHYVACSHIKKNIKNKLKGVNAKEPLELKVKSSSGIYIKINTMKELISMLDKIRKTKPNHMANRCRVHPCAHCLPPYYQTKEKMKPDFKISE